MLTKPDCKCFNDTFTAASREADISAFGVASGEFLRGSATVQLNVCPTAWTYLAGAGLCGMATTVAFGHSKEGEDITYEQILQAMEDIVKAGRERLLSARLQIMKVEGSG